MQILNRICQLILIILTSALILSSNELFGDEFAHVWRFTLVSSLSLGLLTIRPIRFKNINQSNLFNVIAYCAVGTYYRSSLMCSIGVFFFIQLLTFAYGVEYHGWDYHPNFINGIWNISSIIIVMNEHKIRHMAVVSGVVGLLGALLKVNIDMNITATPFLNIGDLYVPGMIMCGFGLCYYSLFILAPIVRILSHNDNICGYILVIIAHIVIYFEAALFNINDLVVITQISLALICVDRISAIFEYWSATSILWRLAYKIYHEISSAYVRALK